MRLSLRARLLLLTTGLLLAGLTLISAVVSHQLERYQLDRLDSQLRSFTEIVANVAPTGPASTQPARPGLLDPALDLVGAPYLAYLDAQGTVVGTLRSSRVAVTSFPSDDGLRSVPTNSSAVVLRSASGDGRWRAVARPATGWSGTVIAAAPLTDADATIAQLRTTSLVSGGALLVLLTAVGWWALGRGLRPLRRIEHTAAAIADGDLTQRVPVLAARSTEIGHLATSLNTMLGQLEQAFADRAEAETRMRSFLADVSHELRTPLVGIKGSTELYRMGGSDVDEAMGRIDREATRLTALTEDLLLLAQLDEAPDGQLELAPMDLRTIANDARHDLRALDPARAVTLTGVHARGAPGPAAVNGDENRLRQVVTNLVGNAVAHTPPGTAVRIRVGTTGDTAVLMVEDEGPGMTDEQADRVFDRFYRADRGRKHSAGAATGLGLAIARSIARAHGGDVILRTALGAGASFQLWLPVLASGQADVRGVQVGHAGDAE
ncbi:MAG TPA: HAMP domain-containing sensor histidine kinase [Kribbella sp.]